MKKKAFTGNRLYVRIIKNIVSLILVLCFCIPYYSVAQEKNDKSYEAAIALVNDCSLYDMDQFDTMYQLTVVDTFRGRIDSMTYWGWIAVNYKDSIDFITSQGRAECISKNHIVSSIDFLPDDIGASTFLRQHENQIWMGDWGKNYLIALWFQKKGNRDYARKFLKEAKLFPDDETIKTDFGTLYYDAMLKAYAEGRNYALAIKFGKHLSKDVFREYKYKKEIALLTAQLKDNADDFVSFRLPGYKEWDSIKQTMNRAAQIKYLTERLRLLNCIQPGQPAGISYTMEQFSVSFAFSSGEEELSYWEPNKMYSVLNPYNELKKMKLNTQELKLLLPFMLCEMYIPTYTYFRNFSAGRTLHRLNWVVNDLLFDITNTRVIENRAFDLLDTTEKKQQVEKITAWCNENKDLDANTIMRKILYNTHNWEEFRKALAVAVKEGDSVVIAVLEQRFDDFSGDGWPSNQGVMANVMFERGSLKDSLTVRHWLEHTTDNWVTLWTSLFLIKYDKNSYTGAMQKLTLLLKECDGTTFYPHAMDLLLSLPDPKAKQLAEGILKKEHYQSMIYWEYYFGLIKKLLKAKSDYACSFLYDKLNTLTFLEGAPNVMYPDDMFVLAGDQLRSGRFELGWSREQKKVYSRELAHWLDKQYKLYKTFGQSELDLSVAEDNIPYFFIDTPR
jgi:hypothetical protein